MNRILARMNKISADAELKRKILKSIEQLFNDSYSDDFIKALFDNGLTLRHRDVDSSDIRDMSEFIADEIVVEFDDLNKKEIISLIQNELETDVLILLAEKTRRLFD